MRKRIVSSAPDHSLVPAEDWLDLERLAQAEVTSEDPAHPIEAALLVGSHGGWRAAEAGMQTVRLLFDVPQALRRILLVFTERENARTQEFVLRYVAEGESASREIVRQQWTFSPQGGTKELEDYRVEIQGAILLEPYFPLVVG
jgi:hypothetical protein